ncbi:MAG: Crp/Fnr family transcriptional regulator [Alphaproteobacteria bacterium]|nr:Crp/Fnr family transcriptional regulator [Alphaproteobacteria bacterium]
MAGIAASVPAFRQLEAEALPLLEQGARLVRVGQGQAVFMPGQTCAAFLVVRAGSVKVCTVTEAGRELLLYRVGPGETCVLTTACLLSSQDYDAEGVAETDTEAVVIPKAVFDQLLGQSARFRHFIFSSYGERLHGLIALVQEVSLRQVDRRLARFLAEKGDLGPIEMTHQDIAAEIGTAREVVSRLLKHFESQGLLRLERRRIVIADAARLASFHHRM